MLGDRFASLEPPDGDHAPTLACRTTGRRVFRALWGIARAVATLHRSLGSVEVLSCEADHRVAVAVRKESVVADADKSTGKDVSEETTKELDSAQGHDALLAPLGIVLPEEGHLRVLQCDEAGVRDRDAMGVPREIPQDVLGTAEGGFRVDKPVPCAVRRSRTPIPIEGEHSFRRKVNTLAGRRWSGGVFSGGVQLGQGMAMDDGVVRGQAEWVAGGGGGGGKSAPRGGRRPTS